MDGKEFMMAVRKQAIYKKCYIALASADEKSGDDVKGFDHVLCKPLAIKDLKILINKLGEIQSSKKCTCYEDFQNKFSAEKMQGS